MAMRYLITLMLLAACDSTPVEDSPDAGPVAIRWAGTYTIEYTPTTANACQGSLLRQRIEDERVSLEVEATLEPGIVRLTFRTLNEQGPGLVGADGSMTTTIMSQYYDQGLDAAYDETFQLEVTPWMYGDGTVYRFDGTATLTEIWVSGFETGDFTCIYTVQAFRD